MQHRWESVGHQVDRRSQPRPTYPSVRAASIASRDQPRRISHQASSSSQNPYRQTDALPQFLLIPVETSRLALFVYGPEVRDDLGLVRVFDRVPGDYENGWRASEWSYRAQLLAADTHRGRRLERENLRLDLHPRSAFNEDVDLLARGVPMADRRAPARTEPQVTHADVLTAKHVAQDPHLELVLRDSEPRLRPVRCVLHRQHCRPIHRADGMTPRASRAP